MYKYTLTSALGEKLQCQCEAGNVSSWKRHVLQKISNLLIRIAIRVE